MPNEEPLLPDRPDSDLADEGELFAEVPDPAGPPVPVEGTIQVAGTGVGAIMTLITVLACGGVVVTLMGGLAQPCQGATQTAQLQWQERQAEVDRIVDEQLAQRQVAAEPAEQADRIVADD